MNATMFANMSIEEFNVPECPVVSRGKQNNSTEQEIEGSKQDNIDFEEKEEEFQNQKRNGSKKER